MRCWNTSSRCGLGGGGGWSSAGKEGVAIQSTGSWTRSICWIFPVSMPSRRSYPFEGLYSRRKSKCRCDPKMKLSLGRSTIQQWVSRSTRHLAQFQSRSMMIVPPTASTTTLLHIVNVALSHNEQSQHREWDVWHNSRSGISPN